MREKPKGVLRELPKKEKIMLLSGIVIVLGTIVTSIVLARRNTQKGRKPFRLASPLSTLKSRGSSGFKCSSRSYPLGYGSCHGDVRILQKLLRVYKADLGHSGKNRDGIDGRFGAKTASAAKKQFGKTSFTPKDIEAMKITLKKPKK